MNILNGFNTLETWKKHCIYVFILVLITSALTYHYTAKHYQSEYDTLSAQFTTYKVNHPDTTELKTEQAIIDKALDDKKNNVPITEAVGTESTTTIQYVQKQSSNDADVEVTNAAKPISISYNGTISQLKTNTTETQSTTADGKVVINQQTSAVLDVTGIVNEKIANRILEDEHKEQVLKRQKTQQTVWGVVAGVAIGHFVKK